MHRRTTTLGTIAQRLRGPARLTRDHVMPFLLSAAGCALLAAGAWTFHPAAGLAAAGLGCWIMEFRIRG